MIDGLAGGETDVGDAKVDITGEPPVELDLTMAGPLPPFARGKVQEPEIDRLLQLKGAITDEETARTPRFAVAPSTARAGRCRGLAEARRAVRVDPESRSQDPS
jgi:hypothetical protein